MLFRGLSIVLGLTVSVMTAEVVLNVYDPPALQTKLRLIKVGEPAVYYCYSSNPNGEFQPLPDLSQGQWRAFNYQMPMSPVPLSRLEKTPYCVKSRRSSQKLRDREYEATPPSGVLRILGVGDSFAMGLGVPVERSLFKTMERLLGSGFEVVNAGFTGSDTHGEIDVLTHYAARLNCTRAIVVFIPNDIQLSAELQTRQQSIFDLINILDDDFARHQQQAWYGRSRLLRLAAAPFELRRIEQQTISWYIDSYEPRYNAENLQLLAADLIRLATLADCEAAFVMYPLMCGLENEYPLARVHDIVGKMARTAGLPVLDLAPVFQGMTTEKLWVHASDHHPNGKAHTIAAKAIVDWLRRDVPDFLIDERANSQRPEAAGVK